MSTEQARVRAVVRGVVQGVGFRYFVLRAARDARLTGFVKNLRDGSVEVVSEGPKERLEALIHSLRTGPRGGLVRDVDVAWSEPTSEFSDFDVTF